MGDKDRAHCRPERGTDVLVDFPIDKVKKQTEVCKENKAGRKQNPQLDNHCNQDEKKENKILIYGRLFVVAALSTLILEKFLFEYIHYITIADIITSIISFFGMATNVIADAAELKDDYVHLSHSDRFLVGRKIHMSIWRRKPVLTYYFEILIIANVVVFASKYTIYAKAAELIKYICESVAEYKDNVEEKERRSDTEPTTSNEEKENNNEESTGDEALYSHSEQEMIKQFGEENYRVAKNIIVSEADRNQELILFSVDYNALFQLEGEYKIENWDNQEEIDAVVLWMIEDEISLKKQNIFDIEAPDWLKTNVNAANIKEAEIHTFAERIGMIETRKDAYGMYPKGSLAQLIANDNQALALALVLNDGKTQTEIYYYGESIFWGLEYLGFADVSTSAVKEKVNWIAERYKDIQFICSETDPEYMYAEKLMIAYKHAADKFLEKGE